MKRALESRLISLEADFTAFGFGCVRAFLTNEKSKQMLWSDALEMALCGEISGVESDAPIDQPIVTLINQGIIDREEVQRYGKF